MQTEVLMYYRSRSGKKKDYLSVTKACPENTIYFASMTSEKMLGMVSSSLDVAILERKILYKTAVLKGTETLLGLELLGKRSWLRSFVHWGTLIYRVNLAKACFGKMEASGFLFFCTIVTIARTASSFPSGFWCLLIGPMSLKKPHGLHHALASVLLVWRDSMTISTLRK